MRALSFVIGFTSLLIASETRAGDDTQPIAWMVNASYGHQMADVGALNGNFQTVLFGLRYAASGNRRDHLEFGLSQLRQDVGDAPVSRLVVGTRSAWSWGGLSLQLAGHLGYGDKTTTRRGTVLDGGFADLGLGVYYDLVRLDDRRLGVGLSSTGTVHHVAHADDRDATLGGMLQTGLSVLVW